MITPATIYFIGILDSIKAAFGVLCWAAGICSIIFAIFGMMIADEMRIDIKIPRRCLFMCIAALPIFIILDAFTPSSKLAASMFIVPAVANNENVQAIGSNGLEALRKLTEDWLRELNGEKKPQDKDSKI